MAEQKDLDFTYTTIDKIFRYSIGETADYSGAKYDGDFSMSLEDAQHAKHKFIADMLNIKAGSRVLDMACGWGPMVPRFLTDNEFRHQVAIFRVSPNRICFEKEIMDHYRLVFEKRNSGSDQALI